MLYIFSRIADKAKKGTFPIWQACKIETLDITFIYTYTCQKTRKLPKTFIYTQEQPCRNIPNFSFRMCMEIYYDQNCTSL